MELKKATSREYMLPLSWTDPLPLGRQRWAIGLTIVPTMVGVLALHDLSSGTSSPAWVSFVVSVVIGLGAIGGWIHHPIRRLRVKGAIAGTFISAGSLALSVAYLHWRQGHVIALEMLQPLAIGAAPGIFLYYALLRNEQVSPDQNPFGDTKQGSITDEPHDQIAMEKAAGSSGPERAGLPISICEVKTPDGFVAYVTLSPLGVVMKRGVIPEEIIGQLIDSKLAGESVDPENFAPNRVFVDFMHDVIKRHGPNLPGLIEAARTQDNGWIYILDGRTPTLGGAVPPEDIVGAFEVRDRQIIPNSYMANPNHRVLSHRGFFQLEPALQQKLLDEIANRTFE